MLSSLVTPNSREKQYIINNKGGKWNDRSSWRIQRRAKRKGRKVTYKTNGPNKKIKKGVESNLNTHVILNINGIQLKVKNCQTRLKTKPLYSRNS